MKVERRTIIPSTLKDIPAFPSDKPGLVTTNGSFRVERPVCNRVLCNGCHICYLHCPDGAIRKDGKSIEIDLDYCKGCGICKKLCTKGAITMEPEK